MMPGRIRKTGISKIQLINNLPTRADASRSISSTGSRGFLVSLGKPCYSCGIRAPLYILVSVLGTKRTERGNPLLSVQQSNRDAEQIKGTAMYYHERFKYKANGAQKLSPVRSTMRLNRGIHSGALNRDAYN